MDRTGRAVGFTKEGSLLVKGSVAPRDGSEAYGPDKRRIGLVQRVFGPVKEPYVVIRLNIPTAERNRLVGKDIFHR